MAAYFVFLLLEHPELNVLCESKHLGPNAKRNGRCRLSKRYSQSSADIGGKYKEL
jgi:hypothetical protein